MKIYDVTRQEDGSVKVESILTAEETKFMLEFAFMSLIQRGLIPASVQQYIEEHKDELESDAQQQLLESLDKDKIPQA